MYHYHAISLNIRLIIDILNTHWNTHHLSIKPYTRHRKITTKYSMFIWQDVY